MLLSEIPLLSAHEIIRAHFGYKPIRQTGSHIHLINNENRRLVTVPNQKEIAVGTFLSILRQATIGREDFLHYLQ
jgi:predicted RNA binding protein YcfA (HicA-like mRNA interferase family)